MSSSIPADPRPRFLHGADKVSCIVRAAASLVARHLRVRAERACADRGALRVSTLALRSNDLIRSDAFLNPAFERKRHIVLRIGLHPAYG